MSTRPKDGPDDQWWIDSDERADILRALKRLSRVPVWVTVSMHLLLLLVTALMIGNTVLSFSNYESNVRSEALLEQTVQEARQQNQFWARMDSIRVAREHADSARRGVIR